MKVYPIYLMSGEWDLHSSIVIKVFVNYQNANNFVDECIDDLIKLKFHKENYDNNTQWDYNTSLWRGHIIYPGGARVSIGESIDVGDIPEP